MKRLLGLILCVTILVAGVSAAQAATLVKNGLEITLVTNKSSYDAGVNATSTLNIASSHAWSVKKTDVNGSNWFILNKTSRSAGNTTLVLTLKARPSAGNTYKSKLTFTVNGETLAYYVQLTIPEEEETVVMSLSHPNLKNDVLHMSIDAGVGATMNPTIGSTHQWKVTKKDITGSNWFWLGSSNVSSLTGPAGSSKLTLTLKKKPSAGQTYKSELIFNVNGKTFTFYVQLKNADTTLNAKRQAVVNRADEWLEYEWETPCVLALHKGNTLPEGTLVYGVPYSLQNGGVTYTPTTYESDIRNKLNSDGKYKASLFGSYSGGKTPLYGAGCTQLVWDCWSFGGFPYTRDRMVSNHPDVVVKVDWENVKPGDAFRLNESVSKDKNGNVTFGHIMLVVDVDLNSKTYTIIEQTSGARKAWDESRKRYKIGTTISTYKIGEKAYTNGSTGKSYTLEDAYTPYKYTGFDK